MELDGVFTPGGSAVGKEGHDASMRANGRLPSHVRSSGGERATMKVGVLEVAPECVSRCSGRIRVDDVSTGEFETPHTGPRAAAGPVA